MVVNNSVSSPRQNLRWAHRGGSLEDLLGGAPEAVPLAPPAPDEVIARVEAVSICSSDIKVVRMGPDHPLAAQAAATGSETVLGHEVSLRVEEVGSAQADRYRPGQRLALQPAMRVDGKRRIIGFDVPGGFAQYLRLGPDALGGYVFDVPETLSSAEIALLEPYGCVERTYRPNTRQTFNPEGTALIVLGPDAERYASGPLEWRRVVLVAAPASPIPSWLTRVDVRHDSLSQLPGEPFDDILALGELTAEDLSRLPPMLAEQGLLLQARQTGLDPLPVEAARIHYDRLALVGTNQKDFADALSPERQRFEVRPGGIALVHGAGGAMGRIHVHRLLQLQNGPATVIATSRKGTRLADLEADFAPMAAERNRRLIVVDVEQLAEVIAREAPGGLDDVAVVVPDSAAVVAAAGWLAPDGLLAVFAGFPYGQPIPFDLTGIAVTGKRITGSTGCLVQDMQDVLERVLRGELQLLANLKAIGGLNALPKALDAVSKGAVSGKVVIYPQVPNLPFRTVDGGWDRQEEQALEAVQN